MNYHYTHTSYTAHTQTDAHARNATGGASQDPQRDTAYWEM